MVRFHFFFSEPFRIWNSWPPFQQRTSRRRCVSRVAQPKRACTSTPINGFRLLTDVHWPPVHLLHATFHGDQRCSSFATPVNGRDNANPFFCFSCATRAPQPVYRVSQSLQAFIQARPLDLHIKDTIEKSRRTRDIVREIVTRHDHTRRS